MGRVVAALLAVLALAWYLRRQKPEPVWTGWRELERVDSV